MFKFNNIYSQTNSFLLNFLAVVSGCGKDVHKDTVVATIKGVEIRETTETFQTFTSSLTDLHDWLKSVEVTHAAMESTGVYWKLVFFSFGRKFRSCSGQCAAHQKYPQHKT